jgi:GNAT superfamily N-acetyltransferase
MGESVPAVIIRQARREDYDDLVAIGDVIMGKDYLEYMFHSFLDDPDMYSLVAEADGKAVGYYANHILDNGQTVIKRAARVHPSYRGHGIFHRLSDELEKHWRQNYPEVKFETFSTINKADRAAKEFQAKGFEEILRKRILNMTVRVNDLKGLDNPEVVQQVTRLTQDDVRLLFRNNELVDRLVPKSIFFNWYIGYRRCESNIKYISNDREFLLASTSASLPSSQNGVKGQQQNNFTPETLTKIDILSCAHKHIGGAGLCYAIDFYTADGYDESLIKAHLTEHFSNFRKSTNNDGVTMISFNSNVKEDIVLSYLKDLGIVGFAPEMETQKVLYLKKV